MSTQHDPKNVRVLYNGVPITGFAKGTFVEYEQKEDDIEIDVGADGESTFIRKRDEQGFAKLTLKHGVTSAFYLSAEVTKQKASPIILPGVLMIFDENTGTELLASQAVIKKRPGKKFDDGAPTVEYEFIYPNAIETDGISLVV